jgi:hypothetical protein
MGIFCSILKCQNIPRDANGDVERLSVGQNWVQDADIHHMTVEGAEL